MRTVELRIARAAVTLAVAAAVAFPAAATAASGGDGGSPRAGVVGGDAADPGTLPWLAFIAYDRGDGTAARCTGTVVAPTLVLTAAHCAVDPGSGTVDVAGGYRVVTGATDLTSTSGEVSAVVHVIPYPGFKMPRDGYLGWGDAALLQLAAPIQAPPIALAATAFWQPGTEAAIAGWGSTSADADPPVQLHWATTYVQGTEWCTENAPGIQPSGQLCAIDPSSRATGPCGGDSGGPLLAVRPGTSELVEIGVVSLGFGDCDTALPAVFTRSDLIAPWVGAQIAAAGSAAAGASSQPQHKGPSASPLPAMTASRARAGARRALAARFGSSTRRLIRFGSGCRRLSRTRRRCHVRWRRGRNAFYGWIAVYYTRKRGALAWGSRFAIRRVRRGCRRRGRTRPDCRVQVRRGRVRPTV